MTSRDFCFWLQGFAEINGEVPSAQQWLTIKKHLNMVFIHEIDPTLPDPDGKLTAEHEASKPKPPKPEIHFHKEPLARC